MLIRQAGYRSFLLAVFAAAILLTCCGGSACAQGLASLESLIGPIWPKGGLCNSFRSEVGTAYSATSLVAAKLTGSSSSTGEYDLVDSAFLDENPSKYDIHADLRLWRVALKGGYTYFDTKSRHVNFGGLDFTGMRLGGGLDIVQLQYWTFGLCADFYFIDPRYRGTFVRTEVPLVVPIDLTGSRPSTWGAYLRYVPPAIIGIPLHLEAFYNLPLQGSRLTTYGVTLAFRPQLYRFDVAAKLGLEATHLKFSGPRDMLVVPSQNWEIDLEWNMIRLEVAAYF